MVSDSKMLEILRQIGEAKPAPIRLSKLLVSPPQDFFSFSISGADRAVSDRIFEALGDASVNIRFIANQVENSGNILIQLSVDSESANKAARTFRTQGIIGALRRLHHHRDTVILSLYPFNGHPQVAERVFTVLGHVGVEILGVNTATSVISCVIGDRDVPTAVAQLKDVFVLQ